jgi:hypothetical protein
MDTKPGIALQTAEKTGESGAATETADVQLAQVHAAIVIAYNAQMVTTRALPAETARLLARLQADLQEIFGTRFESLVLYGTHAHATAGAPARAPASAPVHTLALVASLTYADLTACAGRMRDWAGAGLATPLLLGADEFAASLDAFPLEYGAIIAHHQVLHGSDPFAGISVDPEDVRRACEVQAKSHLLHLREGFIETGGRGDAVARLIQGSIGSFTALLVNLATLDGAGTGDGGATTPDALARYAESRVKISGALITRLLALASRPTPSADEAIQLYPPYLDASDTLARFVDRWKERSRA